MFNNIFNIYKNKTVTQAFIHIFISIATSVVVPTDVMRLLYNEN